MKCYVHAEVEATGVCTRCGKAGCRECLEEVGQVLVCRTCLATGRDERRAGDVDRIGAPMDPTAAHRRIRLGWIIAAVATVGVLIFYLAATWTLPDMPPRIVLVVPSLIFGYIVWASYWGVPRVWRWWRTVSRPALEWLSDRFRFTRCVILVLLLFLPATFTVVALYFWIPFLLGIAFGVFGGGIVEYRAFRRLHADA